MKTCFQGNEEEKLPAENKQRLKWFDLLRISIVRGRVSSQKHSPSFSPDLSFLFFFFLQTQTVLKSLFTIIIN